jgi:catechol 2,3-dioxygenase-like lactoylglutathione lyase family enzyme
MVHADIGLSKQFEYEGGVGIGNDNVLIVFSTGKPSPKTIGHISFHLPNMTALKKALAHLKKHKVEVEDPGDEIGAVATGSKSMGLWFHDPDGYRWELAVRSKK